MQSVSTGCAMERLDDPRYAALLRLAQRHFAVLATALTGFESGRSRLRASLGLSAAEQARLVASLAGQGERFAGERLRFQFAFPLAAADGAELGQLWLFDERSREFSVEQREALGEFAELAAALFEPAPLRDDSGKESLRLALAVEGSGTGIWDRHVPSGTMHYSRGWKALLGYAEEDIGERIEESYTRIHPDDLAYVKATIEAHFDGRTPVYEVEHRIRRKDGEYMWVCSRGKVVERDGAGRALRMLGTTTDITALRGLSERLRENVELLTDLTNEIPGMVFQFRRLPDGSARFPYVSGGSREIYGMAPEELADAPTERIRAIIHPEDMPRYLAALEASARTMVPWQLEYRVLLPELGVRWRQGHAHPRRQTDGSVLWHGFITDITERKRIEAELQVLATTDFLTQLPNRRCFMHQLQAELARVQRGGERSAAVLMCDLDHFKAINDRWGHAVGDLALRHFADILGGLIRRNDSVGRMGGEEFAVVLSDANRDNAVIFAQRLQDHVALAPLLHEGERIPLSLSIGIADMDAGDATAEAVLSRSDLALYRAKQNGRNRIEYL
ncbi:sensor domain-containing diguanylate cyclase [Pseudomonas citronellolis]|uniref:sensor domain-containing diguanylate cyclase n=1 Tax=Pseudomonas citronellolis TaxID=53408 RepID=UPI003D338D2E